jgi:translation initiation factor IF-2
MGKIRINELARELEVKPARLLELLPEFGITDKRTHSSSLEDDVANRLRRHFGFLPAEPEHAAGQVQAPEAAVPIEAVGIEEAPKPHGAAPHIAGKPAVAAAPVTPTAAAPDIANGAVPAEPVVSREEFLATRAAPQRLRPPLAGGRPPAEETPPPFTAPARPAAVQAKPVPMAPRPGQILTGPRQPMPLSVAESPKTVLSAPGAPQRRPIPAAPPPAAATFGRPAARSTLAGQPVARPVVPPRPDLVARLSQPKSMPGQPQPRPMRPASTPIPGQPIYRGPIRPGQTIRPAGPGGLRPVRGKTMHPTSAGRVDAPVAPPTDSQRRPGERRPASRAAIERERQQDREEKLLRPAFRRQAEAVVAVNQQITVAEGITVKELSEKLGLKANLLIKKLFERKIFTTINQTLDLKLAMEIAKVFGAEVSTVSFEEEAVQEVQEAQVDKDLVRRPPVVTVMGHVDHGKTSLLDAIRSTTVAEREAGGITQHIGAYSVVKNDRQIVFIDTPGHEAFTRMRARGAKVTDIVVLVVAADDGVMPQTLEAIDHARAAGVPIIVAVNKIDKADAQPERVKQQLADRGLLAEDWGGDTVFVPVSARAKQNLDLLLEMVLLVADMQDLKANPARPGMGNVLEAKLDRGRGPVATVLVQNGTLSVGDYFICGSVFGKVRAMYDDRGRPIRSGGPSTPVEVLGLDSLPEVGDTFQVVTDTAKAKQIVIYREVKAREQAMARTKRLTLDELHEQLKAGETKELPIILKTDVSGTAEVLSDALQKLSTDKVKIRVLHASVGAITETDVLLASASNAVVIGFNVRPERNAAQVAERDKVDIRLHTIIYELVDEMKRAMTGLLEPVYKEVYRGRAEVRDTFKITKVGSVAGCIVLDGQLTRDSSVRVLRDNVVVHTGKIGSLRRFKNDVSEVKSGAECGVTIDNFGDFKPGDIFEAYVTERVAVETMA